MSKSILFVDDEDWSVTPYFPKLQDHQVEWDLARDGDQALDWLRKKNYDGHNRSKIVRNHPATRRDRGFSKTGAV